MNLLFYSSGYDKLTHGESAVTELLLVGTMALSSLTSYMNQYWSRVLARPAQNAALWDDVVVG